MSEIESKARDIYSSAQGKTQMLAEGEFFCHIRNSYSATGKLQIRSSYQEPEGDEYTVPQAIVHIKYSPYEGKEVEYTIDPSDFSRISMKQEPIGGIIGKFVKPRTVASEKDLDLLDNAIAFAHPTEELFNNLDKEKRRIKINDSAMERFTWEREQVLRKQEEDRFKENKAKREAVKIIEEIKPDTQCLGIVVDDYPPKFYGDEGLLNSFKKAEIDCEIEFHLLPESGEAVRVITHIQKLMKESENNLPVVVFMDGTMPECEYESGIATVKALKARLDNLGLTMPYLVGNSNDPWKNDRLKEENPECYLTSLDYEDRGWSAIKAVIKEDKNS